MAGRRARLRSGIAAAAVAALAALVLLLTRSPPPAPGRRGAEQDHRSPPASSPDRLAGAPRAARPLADRLPSPAPGESPRASLEGRVASSETGAGVPGAELTFSRGGAAAGVRAEADGRFRFEPPADGRWLLAAVTAPGHLPFAPEWEHSPVVFEARAGHALRGIEILLAPATALAVTVLDPEDVPVSGAEVRILGASTEAALVSLADRFTSDGAGQVRLSAPRDAVVEARKAGFAPGRAAVDLAARASHRLSVRLGAGGSPEAEPGRIAGRVVERGGVAIAGALVVAERELGYGAVGPAVAQAVSAADGAFAVEALDPGRYRLTARADGRARGVLRRVAAGSEAVTLELAPGGRLRGCVRDEGSGAAVTAFTVLVSERRAPLARSAARSRSFFDGSGCWSMDDLSAGPVAVVVAAPGYAPSGEVAAEVPESGEGTVDAAVAREGRLSGVVLDAVSRAPLPGARVAVEGTLPEGASVFPVLDESVADARGRFVLRGLPARFSLAAAAPGHHLRVVSGLRSAPGKVAGPVEIALTPALAGEEPRREFAGIGVTVAPRGEAVVVTAVLPGGGAAEAGVARGDAILAVDGVPVTVLGFGGALDAIRGAEGTTVVLRVRRGESTLDLRVGRGIVRG